VHAEIQRRLAERFPRPLDPVQELTFAMTPDGPTPPQVQQSAVRFSDPDETEIVAIGTAMASFETTRYRGWEEFLPSFETVLGLVAELGEPTACTRLGLRYVDELDPGDARGIGDWTGILAQSVLGSADSLLRDPRVVETSQLARIRLDDDEVRVRHGYVERPGDNGETGSIYVLDTDASTTLLNEWNIETLIARLQRYHGLMTNVFGRSLTPEGLERLGGRVNG
jgi:uncharacterized protein (TIGR04255 family)